MWTWTNRLADLALHALDDGSFFRKPWRVLFRAIALFIGIAGALSAALALYGGVYGCYQLYSMHQYASGVQASKVAILIAAALAFLGLFVSRIWWKRSDALYSHTDDGKHFLVGPILALVVRTLGETIGFGLAFYGILTFLVVLPSVEFVRTVPFVGGYLSGYLKYSVAYVYLSPLVGFLYIMLSRWLADMIEVFFAIANDTRTIRSGMTASSEQATEKAEALPFRAGWPDLAVGILIYAMLALRLDEITVLLPMVAALALCVHFRWKSTMVFLVAAVVALLVRGAFMVLLEMDRDSVGSVYLVVEQPLLVGLLGLLLVAMALMVAERLVHWRSSLTFGQAWAIGCGLAVIYCAYPLVKTVQEAMARHELTASELQRAQDLFAPYEGRRFAWRDMDRMDTTTTFMIDAPVISADRYGLITVQHALSTDRRRMNSSFQCHYTDIRLPDSVVYSPENRPVHVRYMNGDSLLFRFVRGDQWITATAVAVDVVQRLSEMTAERRAAAFHAYRDSLHALVDTLHGRFVSYECVQEPCFAWFDVEDSSGIAKRSFYCSGATVSGYPINALPKDDTRWTLVIRRSVLETPEALNEGTGPVLYELTGLTPEAKPRPTDAVPVERREPAAKETVKATPGKVKRDMFTVDEVDQEPNYPGGQSALRRYLASRRYPEVERANAAVRKLRVQFMVTSSGTVEKVAVVGGQGNSNFDTEAVRLVSAMPRWTPGIKDGVPVAVRMEVTVNFSLSE